MGVFVGDNLRNVRESLKLTQGEMADILSQKFNVEVSQQMVSDWENGENDPSAPWLLGLSQAFDISVDYLLGAVVGPHDVYGAGVSREEWLQRLNAELSKYELGKKRKRGTGGSKGDDKSSVVGN